MNTFFSSRLALVAALTLLTAGQASAQVALQDQPHPSNVMVQMTDEGWVYADAKGMTIYTGNDPKAGVSSCTSNIVTLGSTVQNDFYPLPYPDRLRSCIQNTPPLLVGNAQPVAGWTVIDRPDGLKQWAYRGKPLYTSNRDRAPGDINGNMSGRSGRGANGYGDGAPVFAPVKLPSQVMIKPVGIARVLATTKGYTLYTLPGDGRNKSNCDDKCQEKWLPVEAPALAQADGDWSVAKRSGKASQWAFKGKPIYTYVNDTVDSGITGDGVDKASVALAYPLPPVPPEITITRTSLGWFYADKAGWTVYNWQCRPGEVHGSEKRPEACDTYNEKTFWWYATCGDEKTCPDVWRPVLVAKNEENTWKGHMWSIVTLPEPWGPVAAPDGSKGRKVWAFKGRPVFTYGFEDFPGMVDGYDVGVQALQKWAALIGDGSLIGRPMPKPVYQAAAEMKAAQR